MTQDLAHRIARQCLDKVDAGSVEPAELLIERNSQPFRIDRRRGFNNDMDFLLAAVVLRGKQTDAADAKQLAQPILDGRRRNFASLHIDDISDASLQRHAPVGSHDSQIPGIEEAVFEEGPRRRFVMEIAGGPPAVLTRNRPILPVGTGRSDSSTISTTRPGTSRCQR